jgi:hypothetical protein
MTRMALQVSLSKIFSKSLRSLVSQSEESTVAKDVAKNWRLD